MVLQVIIKNTHSLTQEIIMKKLLFLTILISYAAYGMEPCYIIREQSESAKHELIGSDWNKQINPCDEYNWYGNFSITLDITPEWVDPTPSPLTLRIIEIMKFAEANCLTEEQKFETILPILVIADAITSKTSTQKDN